MLKNHWRVNNFSFYHRILILFVLFLVLSCKENYPKNEKECLVEVKLLNEFIYKEDYESAQLVLRKYENYKVFSIEDIEKKCSKLSEFLKRNGLETIAYKTSYDSLGVERSDTYSLVHYFIINCIIDGKQISIYKYAVSEENKSYVLTYFNHLLNPKVAPTIPIIPK
jgi:hypothetical protein